ncbi:MAG: hypothetical protein PVSMB8_00100 [Vulcanimicrobiaceae bacterium]
MGAVASVAAEVLPASAGEEPVVFACCARIMTALKIALRFVPPEGCDSQKERMRGVQFRVKANKLTICATDGHRLMRWEQMIAGAAVDSSIVMTPESVEAAHATLKRDVGLLQFFPRSRLFKAGEYEASVVLAAADFPRWEDIVRNAETPVARGVPAIGMNASYAAEAPGSFQAACSSPEIKRDERPYPYCRFEFVSDMDPIRVTSPNVPELFVLVMPVRL